MLDQGFKRMRNTHHWITRFIFPLITAPSAHCKKYKSMYINNMTATWSKCMPLFQHTHKPENRFQWIKMQMQYPNWRFINFPLIKKTHKLSHYIKLLKHNDYCIYILSQYKNTPFIRRVNICVPYGSQSE